MHLFMVIFYDIRPKTGNQRQEVYRKFHRDAQMVLSLYFTSIRSTTVVLYFYECSYSRLMTLEIRVSGTQLQNFLIPFLNSFRFVGDL